MEAEDFSFPTIGDTFPGTIDSPPLWHLSPMASPNNNSSPEEESTAIISSKQDCFAQKLINNNQRKSFSSSYTGLKEEDEDEEEEDEKMDLLWEDLNEELFSSTSYSSRSNTSSSRDMGCLNYALTTTSSNSKTSSTAVVSTARKPGMVAIMSVFKKLFLLHNSHRKLKKANRS